MTVEHVIPGRLTITAHDQSIRSIEGPVLCWTFLSHGLSRLGQSEVALSVRRRDPQQEADITIQVREFYGMLHELAAQRRLVDVGQFTTLAPDAPGILGDSRLRGVVYAFPEPFVDEPFPLPTIAAVPLRQGELDAGLKFGAVRLLALLGNRHRRFPTATWLDPDRQSVTSVSEMQTSVLAQMVRVTLTHCHVYLRAIETGREARPATGELENAVVTLARQEVVFELSVQGAGEIAEVLGQLGPKTPVALIASPDADADACFCWIPERREPYAITDLESRGARIAGNHLLLIAAQQTDAVAIVEDGFALLVKDSTWQEIRSRLAAGPQNWGMPFVGQIGFRLKTT